MTWSEYDYPTPNTDQVSEAYADTRWDEYGSYEWGGYRAAFDRWLAAEKAKAWDEGYEDGMTDERYDPNAEFPIRNPYRTEVQ